MTLADRLKAAKAKLAKKEGEQAQKKEYEEVQKKLQALRTKKKK